MEYTAASILGPLVPDAAKWVFVKIKRQLSYLFCFTTIITTLEQQAEDLEASTQDLQAKVDRAINEGRLITHTVEAWLAKSKGIKSETDGILNDAPNVRSGCLKLGARFSLSRRAMKTTDRSKELRSQCIVDDDAISQPGPPAATKEVPLGTPYEFESRKYIEEDIVASLVGGHVNMMGICGMGGLGKTTMAKKIMNRALENKVFDEVVMVVVSQPPVNKLRIQLEIGGSLGLSNLKDETSETRAAQKLHARLSGTKRILLVLDDVWDKLVLEDLGIPCNHKGCVILLTSRNIDALTAMKVTKVFGMKVLSEEDAWFLFSETTGACANNTELNYIAKEVVKECKGLPIALITIGAVLRDEMEVPIWRDRLRRLRKCDPNIPGYIANVYNPLKLSYDVLDSEHKSIFLLCCLYPEDADIALEDLTYFCMGLGICGGGITNVEEARDWMCSLTKMLKKRSLLLESECGDDYVRMHDVVRDVCIFIAKEERYIGGNDCKWISSSQRLEFPTRLGFPQLQLLWICNSRNEEFKLDSILLEETKYLHVLSFEGVSLTSLPRTTQSLIYLKTLVLVECKKLKTLCGVGKLASLEILICKRCDMITELPPEVKGLNRLKVLDLIVCRKLERIGRGIISSLVGLEELKMRVSFKKWETEDREEKENAALKELEALTKLRCLEIEIEDPALAMEKMYLSSDVDRFHINFSTVPEQRPFYFFESNGKTTVFEDILYGFRSNKKMSVYLNEEGFLGHWIEMKLLKDTECLCLSGNGVNSVDWAKGQKIRLLELGECETIKKIEKIWLLDRFSFIENLRLFNLPKLKNIWNDRISSHFLPQLEALRIENCDMMEHVFLCKGDSQSSHHITKLFPKLKEIYLCGLSKMTSFYQGIEGIEFTQLRMLTINECGKMKSLVSKGMGSNENNSVGGSSTNSDTHKPQEGFEEFRICGIEGSASLITSSVTKCNEMIKNDEGKGVSADQRVLLFPKLEILYLYALTQLVSLCEWKCEAELPSLREVRIIDCRNMKQLWKSSGLPQNNQTEDYFPQLQILDIRECYMMEQVFLWNGEDENEMRTRNTHHITKIFPRLEKIVLTKLPYLTSFCRGIEGIELPQLRELDIKGCGKMKNVFSKGMGSDAAIQHLSFQPQDVSFGCLKNLTTDWNLFGGMIHVVSLFGRLERLTIQWCEGVTSWITSSIATSLVNLTHLTIIASNEMIQVIKDEEEKGTNGGPSTFRLPKLQELRLEYLPKLVRFSECDVELSSLRKVRITGCRNMKNFTLKSLAAPNLECFGTDLGHQLHLQVPFNGVKILKIWRNKHPLNCYEICESQLNRLEVLEIDCYTGSASLFSASVAETLVNLRELSIRHSYEVVKVMEDEEEKENHVVSDSGQSTFLLFPKLEKLELHSLDKLESFCEWKCDVELPSLRWVRIYDFKSMKYFTLGRLVTPNLQSVSINYKGYGGVKDLNGVLQQEYEEASVAAT